MISQNFKPSRKISVLDFQEDLNLGLKTNCKVNLNETALLKTLVLDNILLRGKNITSDFPSDWEL